MKTILLLFVLSVSALANSVPIATVQLTGVGSGLDGDQFFCGHAAHPFYELNAILGGSGYFTIEEGQTFLFGTLTNPTLSDGMFTSSFTGDELERLAPGYFVLWAVTGNISQTANFKTTGTGIISLTSEVFEGRTAVAPEPPTWLMMGAGILLIISRKKILI